MKMKENMIYQALSVEKPNEIQQAFAQYLLNQNILAALLLDADYIMDLYLAFLQGAQYAAKFLRETH